VEARRRRDRKQRPAGSGRVVSAHIRALLDNATRCTTERRRDAKLNATTTTTETDTASAAGPAASQSCLKKCAVHDDCKGRSRKCLCDAECGLSCIRPSRLLACYISINYLLASLYSRTCISTPSTGCFQENVRREVKPRRFLHSISK